MKNVTVTLVIAVAPQQAIRAFTDEKMLREWWGVERCLVEPRVGGLYTLLWGVSDQGIRYVSTGVIKNYEPGSLLEVGDYLYLNAERPPLGPLELKVSAEPAPGGCILTISQGPYPEGRGEHWDWYFDAVHAAWPQVIQGIKTYLESAEQGVE